jgi:hypothetical protein
MEFACFFFQCFLQIFIKYNISINIIVDLRGNWPNIP